MGFKFRELFWVADGEGETGAEPSAAPGAVADESDERPTTPDSVRRGDGVTTVLHALRDVDGVVGSVLLAREGGVRARDLPRVFDAAAADRFATRVEQLRAMLGSEGHPMESAVAEYDGYRIQLNPMAAGMLCVLAEERTNPSTLGMAVRAAKRRLETALSAANGAR